MSKLVSKVLQQFNKISKVNRYQYEMAYYLFSVPSLFLLKNKGF